MEGPDHRASLEPTELKQMVQAIRNIEQAIIGSGVKKPSSSELQNRELARRSIYVNKDLPAGTILMEKDLICLRPAVGISPMLWSSVIGKKLIRSKKAFQTLFQNDFS